MKLPVFLSKTKRRDQKPRVQKRLAEQLALQEELREEAYEDFEGAVVGEGLTEAFR
jgi:hypothetical protein